MTPTSIPQPDPGTAAADYRAFLSSKHWMHDAAGIEADLSRYPLFPHQHALTGWALRKGRSAIAADTGLGKTRMYVAWADCVHRITGLDVLILVPLAVAEQTVREAADAMGVYLHHPRTGSSWHNPGITIINYDRLHQVRPADYGAVVLDESSIIKHHDSKTLSRLLDAFADTRYKLCCTATIAPNDWTELGTHAEFLGVCTRAEMLAEFFVHDGGETQTWRLKGHARSEFWQWVASWCAMVRSPADLGFDASAYELPPLTVEQVTVGSDARPPQGEMFCRPALTLSDRRQARRDSLTHRVAACAERANAQRDPWIIWTELNAEGDALRAAIPDAIEIRGPDPSDRKEQALVDFAAGRIRVLITKPKIAGFGLNWQHCRNVAFIGATDSWEAYYQAIRRCWRFGQTQPVHVTLYVSEQEGAVRDNLLRKERDAEVLFDQLTRETAAAVRDEVLGRARTRNTYQSVQPVALPPFLTAA